MVDDRTVLAGRDVEAAALADWRIIFAALHARFETGDFATGLRLVAAIGEAAEAADHHPDVDLTYGRVDVRLRSHDVGGVTPRDVRLAGRISEIAAEVGAVPQPSQTSALEVALDTWDAEEIKPFWAALLGYEVNDAHADQLDGPDATTPTIWFQQTERHETPHQRWHFDLRVPPEVVDQRIRRAVEAGGSVVDDEGAPAFWVLADAQGNRACITTWRGRGED